MSRIIFGYKKFVEEGDKYNADKPSQAVDNGSGKAV